jgi:hypothetical protein
MLAANRVTGDRIGTAYCTGAQVETPAPTISRRLVLSMAVCRSSGWSRCWSGCTGLRRDWPREFAGLQNRPGEPGQSRRPRVRSRCRTKVAGAACARTRQEERSRQRWPDFRRRSSLPRSCDGIVAHPSGTVLHVGQACTGLRRPHCTLNRDADSPGFLPCESTTNSL